MYEQTAVRWLYKGVHQLKESFPPYSITSNQTWFKYCRSPYMPPKQGTRALGLSLAKLSVRLVLLVILNGRCTLRAGHGGKPFGHAEIHLPCFIPKLDGEAVCKPHMANAMKIYSICAQLFSKLGDEMNQESVWGPKAFSAPSLRAC